MRVMREGWMAGERVTKSTITPSSRIRTEVCCSKGSTWMSLAPEL